MKSMPSSKRIAIVGAGAAGLMAAGAALENGADVTLFDGNSRAGRKLMITGKGRCNVTNHCDVEEFLQNVPGNPRFLYAALRHFGTDDTIHLFESLGVPLKTERGKRVFPVSDKAADIVDALCRYTQNATFYIEKVKKITAENGKVTGLVTENGQYPFDAVILCTGGKSYPLTGSDGSGYRIAEDLGHSITPLVPSLVPLTSTSPVCRELQGLSLKNIGFLIRQKNGGKALYTDFGEMMFAHFGLTGPVVLSASARLTKEDISNLEAVIDLKPALSEKVLDERLLSDFQKYRNKDFVNALSDLLPQKMIQPLVTLSGIDQRKKVNAVTKEERRRLLTLLKNFTVPLSGRRPMEEAIVTSGGIALKEINPKTMMSQKIQGLYFAGEILDVDAYTGGFNLQIAFSTGHLAGTCAAKSLLPKNISD